MDYILPDLNLLEIKTEISDEMTAKFTIEPLSPGYGITVGNTLRRILLSSLEGCAVVSAKISGVEHEYSTLKGLKEDVVDLILNLKTMRFKLNSDEPAKLEMSVIGPKKISSADFKKSGDVEPVDKEHYIATLEKGGKLEMEIVVARGRGYVPVEKRIDEKLPIGTIMIDSIFTPVKKVKYDIENARVGGMTNYNRLIMEITTDGSIAPAEALSTSAKIMSEHLQVIKDACNEIKTVEKAPKKVAKKKAVKTEK